SAPSGPGGGALRSNPTGPTVTLETGPKGPNTRLVLRLPAGTIPPADYYQLYIPNSGSNAIFDQFGNQADLELLGNQTASGGYEDMLSTGQTRPSLAGDGIAGGAFLTGFVVVPSGHLMNDRPDHPENPLLPSAEPDGSLANPYTALAPEATVAGSPANPTHDPNGGVNDTSNFFNFNPALDRNGNGQFDRSAFYAASQLAFS